MTENKKPNRTMSWPSKLLITTLVAGVLSLLTYWRFSSVFGATAEVLSLLHLAVVIIWVFVVGMSIQLLDRSDWHKSLISGLVLSLAASVLIWIVFFLVLQLGKALVTRMIH